MKFLQVHAFYNAAIRDIYRDATLKHASFSMQTQAILKHGFTGTHLIAPYMQQHGYVPALVIANCSGTQRQWLREMRLPPQLPEKAIVKYQIEAFKPDVLHISDPVEYDSRFIRVLKWRPRLITGWRAAYTPPDVDWSAFDIILSGLRGMRDAALEYGAKKAVHFLPGFPAWMRPICPPPPICCDVSFAGQWSTAHTKRNAYLKTIAEHTQAQPTRTCAFYLLGSPLPPVVAKYNQGPRFGASMYQALRSGVITIDAQSDHDLAGTETSNARLFEATGSGVFLLAERHSNLGEMFEIGREIETFGSALELTAKLMYYKDHPDIREAIAHRGQIRCLRDHSMKNRAQQLHQIIEEHIT